MSSLVPDSYRKIFLVAGLLLGAEAPLLIPFFFAPGWANGWPGGLSIHVVWSSWFALTLFLFLMTAGLGVGYLLTWFFFLCPPLERSASRILGTWLVLWSFLSVAASAWAFTEIYESALEMWPNGYPG